ncbi:conserved hypothetical protein [Ricinus communis]|uniref:Uncharacterized protein n=1 Tax=Ricinus communis TaxID=3988 RepID=B9TB82_RICCO|nr:conserved hypothetical protein [Ricinus communis]
MKRQGTMHSSRAGLSRVRGPIRSTSDRFTEQGVQVKLLACYKLGSGTAVSRFPCSRQLVLDRSDRNGERWKGEAGLEERAEPCKNAGI